MAHVPGDEPRGMHRSGKILAGTAGRVVGSPTLLLTPLY